MNNFKTIVTILKEILFQNTKSKVLDKDVALALNIKASTLASYKRRDKLPYQAILTYCHENRLDVRKVLFNDVESVVDYPAPMPVETGKVQVRYFRTLEVYILYLDRLKE